MNLVGNRTRRAATASVVVLVTALTHVSIPRAHACVLDSIVLETLRVELEPSAKTYRSGDIAEIDLSVERPGREDPAGLGVPIDSPVSAPVEGASAGVTLTVADEYLFAFADPTDEIGKSRAKVEIPASTPAGKPVRVAGFAWKKQVETPCSTVIEQGSAEMNKAFEIRK
jgi:hypothetical protein